MAVRAEMRRREHRCRHRASLLAPRRRCLAAENTLMAKESRDSGRLQRVIGAELHMYRVDIAMQRLERTSRTRGDSRTRR